MQYIQFGLSDVYLAKLVGGKPNHCEVSFLFMQFHALSNTTHASMTLSTCVKSLSRFNLYLVEVIAHITFKSRYIHSMLSRHAVA